MRGMDGLNRDATWLEALTIIAGLRVPAFWCMSNGATFWWMLDQSQLGADRFLSEPFTYSEITSITIFNRANLNGWTPECDLEQLRPVLLSIKGLAVDSLCDLEWTDRPNRAFA